MIQLDIFLKKMHQDHICSFPQISEKSYIQQFGAGSLQYIYMETTYMEKKSTTVVLGKTTTLFEM